VKKALWIASLFFISIAVRSPAQEMNGEIELTPSILQSQRHSIVTAAMQLTEDEGRRFWPLYNEYREAIDKTEDRSVRIVEEYAANHHVLTDEVAREMMEEFMAIEQEKLDVMRKYLKRFQKILPAKKVARLFQLEKKFNAVTDFELAAEIPLVP
jgi:succinylarginine dihydrolase